MSKKRKERKAHPKSLGKAVATSVGAPVRPAKHEHDDDLVIVPKGQSKMRFYLSFGLIIFILIIFVVPSAFQGSLGRSEDNSAVTYASWTTPGGESVKLTYQDFVAEKRALRSLERLLPFLGMGQIDSQKDEDTARFLIMEAVAQESGVRVSDRELARTILELWGDETVYRTFVANSDTTPAQFEAAFRRALAVRTLLSYLSAGAVEQDPERLKKDWLASHQEYAFDVVAVESAAYEEAARAELPDDAALEVWLGERPPFERASYNSPTRWSAEIAWLDLEGEALGAGLPALLEAFPRPADEDPAAKASTYYDSYSHVRFRRDPELSAEENPELSARERLYLPFEEVRAACEREAPVYYSLAAWQTDLAKRMAEVRMIEIVDLKTEAEKFGLSFVEPAEPLSAAEWNALGAPWCGESLTSSMQVTAAGSLMPKVAVERGAFVLARVIEKVPPELPPFEQIRERVADAWVSARRGEIAVERLEAVRDRLGERPAQEGAQFAPGADAQAFQAAAAAEGFEVEHLDFEQRYSGDPFQVPDDAPAREFVRMDARFYAAAEGDVPAAAVGRDGARAFLVRSAGQRDADLSGMKPADVDSLSRVAAQRTVRAFIEHSFYSDDYLKERYRLHLRSWDLAEEGGR